MIEILLGFILFRFKFNIDDWQNNGQWSETVDIKANQAGKRALTIVSQNYLYIFFIFF